MTQVVVPAALAERLEHLIGARVHTGVATLGGHSNLVFTCTDGQGETVVVKAANSAWKRADVTREAEVLRVLADTAVAHGRLVASSSDDEWAVAVMRRVDGRPGLSALAELLTDPDMAPNVGRILGETLLAVHHTAPRPLVGPQFDRAQLVQALVPAVEVCGAPPETIEAVLPALTHKVHGHGSAFVHGDPGLHNVLWGPGQMVQRDRGPEFWSPVKLAALVDWELAGWGNPLADVAWAWWTFQLRELPPAVFDGFARAYGLAAIHALGWATDTVDAMVRTQMAALLVRTEPGTVVRDVWVERIGSLGPPPPLPDR